MKHSRLHRILYFKRRFDQGGGLRGSLTPNRTANWSIYRERDPYGKNFELQSVLVTNKEVVNKSLGEFNLWGNYHATITRVRRSGIDITPNPQLRLLMGDKLMVACSRDNMKQVMSLFGNNDKNSPTPISFLLLQALYLAFCWGSFPFRLAIRSPSI